MIFVELIAHALFIISLTHLPGVYSASSQLTNANSEVGPKTSDYTGVGVPVNSTSIDKFADMPKTYIFDQDFRWGGGDNAVYDKDGKVVYTISTHYDPESTARTIVTKDADDKDLLKAFMVRILFIYLKIHFHCLLKGAQLVEEICLLVERAALEMV